MALTTIGNWPQVFIILRLIGSSVLFIAQILSDKYEGNADKDRPESGRRTNYFKFSCSIFYIRKA